MMGLPYKELDVDNYKKAFNKDEKLVDKYFNNIEKSEQQKFLEELLKKSGFKNRNIEIADIGCGGGKASFHLNQLYNKANYNLLDYNEKAIEIAKNINKDKNFSFEVGNIYNLPYKEDSFDLTVCLVVVSFIENAQKAIDELIRVTKKNGRIIISALINFDHDVDLLTKVLDKTRDSSKDNLYLIYNTFSKTTFDEWISSKISNLKYYKFITEKDFIYDGKGINTYTINTENEKIQLAGGMKLNWGFIDMIK